jgi:sigma-B regulation protein RsbU (phosphoserine phosphatase)
MPAVDASRVLVADDQADVVLALRLLLRDAGLETDTAASVSDVRQRLSGSAYDLLLMDLNYARDTTSGREGLELLTEVRGRYPDLPVVVMTGWGTIETAVDAMRRGARTFVTKPWDNATLAATVMREIAEARAARSSERTARREHEDAQAIQRGLMPAALPDVPGLRLAARWQPASAFGGDWYDALPTGPASMAISIADVCGKGLPAALVMASLQAAARAFTAADASPAAIAARLNRELARVPAPRRLVTGFCACYEASARRLVYSNAGHNPPLLVRGDGSIVRLSAGGMVLGAFEEASYEEREVTLSAGDRLVLYTDGITEAENGSGEPFGEERLERAVLAARTRTPGEIVGAIFDDVSTFAPPPMRDDATVMVAAID